MKYAHLFVDIRNEGWASGFTETLVIENKLKSLENTAGLLSVITEELSDNVLIDGGHYPLEQKGDTIIHKPNQLTVLAFELAVKLFKIAQDQNLNPSLGFLINDMGLDVDARNTFKNGITLHPQYLAILQNNNLTISDITHIFFESNLRNRAGRQILKKGIKTGMVKDSETLLYAPDISDTDKEPDFSNYLGHKKGRLMIPFCRAIMAQKLVDSEILGCKKTINILTEHEFKCLGEFAKVYHLFEGQNNVVNVLLSPFELTEKRMAKYNNSQFSSQSDVYFLKNEGSGFFVQIQKYKINT